MLNIKKIFSHLFIFFYLLSPTSLMADTSEIKEILQLIQKDLRTLERAVYSESFSQSTNSNSNNIDQEGEDVLTRHLLKLSEIENQFKQLTNKYEEINFKIDKLNSRLSKVQADNQLRFEQLETNNVGVDSSYLTKSLTDTTVDTEKILPGSSQPQDLGTVSYKDMTNESESQSIQSIDATKTVVTEIFQSEEKILPDGTPENQYEFATSFLKVSAYQYCAFPDNSCSGFVSTNSLNALSAIL